MNLSATQLLVILAVLVLALVAWRISVRRARAAVDAVRKGVRTVSLFWRTGALTAVLVGAQWFTFAYPGMDWPVRLLALALPDLFAAYVLTRALTVTTVDDRKRRERR